MIQTQRWYWQKKTIGKLSEWHSFNEDEILIQNYTTEINWHSKKWVVSGESRAKDTKTVFQMAMLSICLLRCKTNKTADLRWFKDKLF